MRKTISALLLMTIMMGLSGCNNDDVIWDIYPANIIVKIVDEEGQNLLDPDVEGNRVGCPMSMTYDGETYSAIWDREELNRESRYYMASFRGLIWEGILDSSSPASHKLSFGEFQGDTDHTIDATFTVEGTGKVYVIRYEHKFKWKGKKPYSDDHIYLDGKKYDGNTIEITLPAREINDEL